jgi:hypothetical protein
MQPPMPGQPLPTPPDFPLERQSPGDARLFWQRERQLGTERATTTFHDGQLLEVNGSEGTVRALP